MARMLSPWNASTIDRIGRRGSRVDLRSSFMQKDAPQPQYVRPLTSIA